MRIFLTGATGFLGSHLARRLVNSGHEVLAIRRVSSSMRRLSDVENAIRWITQRPGGVLEAGSFDGVDVIVHLAANYGRQGESPIDVARVNTQLPLELLLAATQRGVAKFIHTDSALPPATNSYTLSKAQFAQWGRLLAETGKVNFINVRLEHIYGPGDDDIKFVSRVVTSCVNNVPELKLTSGEQQRDFIFVSDAVSGLCLLIEDEGQIPAGYLEVPLGSGTTTVVRALVQLIHRLAKSSTQLLFGAVPPRSNDVAYSCADVSMMRQLGWLPVTALEDGLDLTIRSVRQT